MAKIIEVNSGEPLNITQLPPCIGLLVKARDGLTNEQLQQLREHGMARAYVAYVMPNVRRTRRRCVLGLSLSECHGCPCGVFEDETSAKAWLERHIESSA